jgi:alkylation response protein AidB-like acyl-CoA dehydrogenase
MHPDNLRDLNEAGVFRLAMPTDVGGYQADDGIVAEVLAQISRGCPSTGWMCTIMLVSNVIPALLADEAADEIYATPDLRITTTIAPTGHAAPVDGGYRVTGQWTWNTAGVHSNWFAPACVVPGEEDAGLRLMLLPDTEVERQDNWRSAGMAGTATNIATVNDVFVPAARTILVQDLAEGRYPTRRYSHLPYFNRPFVMYINASSAPALLGMARGAMDCFVKTLPTRGPITYTAWPKAAEAPLLHHQLAKAQYDLEAAEMFTAPSPRCIAESSTGRRQSWSGHRPAHTSATSRACPGPASISYSRPAVHRTPCVPPTSSGISATSTCCISMRRYSPTAATRPTGGCWPGSIPTPRSSDLGAGMGYPFTFVVYKQIAADNAAIVTEAFLESWTGP